MTSAMSTKDIPWSVRLDSSVDPVCVVWAPGWYQARAVAEEILNAAGWGRVHVSQFNKREMHEYEKPRAMSEWKAKALREAKGKITASRMSFSVGVRLSEEHPICRYRHVETMCGTCGGAPPVSELPCICGGSGLQRDEIHGLRLTALEYEKELEWLDDTERLEDVRWTMLNDGCSMREAVAKLRKVNTK